MTKSNPYPSEQIEYRFIVDKERAPQVAQALAELALQYDAAIITDQPEDAGFRKYMTTEMYEEFPDKIVSVVSKDDLYRFAIDQRVDTTVASRTFNIICAELAQKRHLKNIKRDDYYVRGPLVNQPAEGKGRRPLEEDGLRVETLADLVAQLGETQASLSGYGQRSHYLMTRFVDALFKPEQPEGS